MTTSAQYPIFNNSLSYIPTKSPKPNSLSNDMVPDQNIQEIAKTALTPKATIEHVKAAYFKDPELQAQYFEPTLRRDGLIELKNRFTRQVRLGNPNDPHAKVALAGAGFTAVIVGIVFILSGCGTADFKIEPNLGPDINPELVKLVNEKFIPFRGNKYMTPTSDWIKLQQLTQDNDSIQYLVSRGIIHKHPVFKLYVTWNDLLFTREEPWGKFESLSLRDIDSVVEKITPMDFDIISKNPETMTLSELSHLFSSLGVKDSARMADILMAEGSIKHGKIIKNIDNYYFVDKVSNKEYHILTHVNFDGVRIEKAIATIYNDYKTKVSRVQKDTDGNKMTIDFLDQWTTCKEYIFKHISSGKSEIHYPEMAIHIMHDSHKAYTQIAHYHYLPYKTNVTLRIPRVRGGLVSREESIQLPQEAFSSDLTQRFSSLWDRNKKEALMLPLRLLGNPSSIKPSLQDKTVHKLPIAKAELLSFSE